VFGRHRLRVRAIIRAAEVFSVRFVLALAFVLFFSGPLAAQQLVTVKVAAIPGDISAQVWYAQDLGYFKQVGLNVEVTPITNGGAISAAVASKSIDIGYSNLISVAVAHQRGIPFEIIAPANLHIASAPTAALLSVRADSPIRNGKDLEGKTIAVSGLNNIIHFATRAWIDSHEGDSSKVRFVELPLTEMAAAVRAGRIDAAGLDALGDPNLGKPGDPLRLLASAMNAVSPNFLPSIWFTTKDWIAAHPNETKKFIAVMRKSAEWANGHHHESAEILARHTRLTVEQLDSITRVTYGTVLNAGLIQPNINVAAKYGALEKDLSAEDLISKLAGGKG
jgi:NitT/TauT family transport system substrate-binding protein